MHFMVLSSATLAGIAIGIVVVIFIAGFVLREIILGYWILTAILMIFFLGTIGKAVNGRWTGILIDESNVMRLSRFQIVIWTVIILSAFLAIATTRIYAGDPDPLAITIDWRLWALLGISSTSLVGTPLILDDKKKKTLKQDVLDSNVYPLANREGIVFKNQQDRDAKFTDLFEGDESGNEKHIDMSKVQMFFFTIIAALSYIVLLFNLFLSGTMLKGLPSLPEGLIAILAISHGTYLTYKMVDHTPGATK
jgi:hypothetical protein